MGAPAFSIGKRRRFAIALSLIVAVQLHGQTTATNTDAATLAKYDKNKNGRLDPDEIGQRDADALDGFSRPS